MIKANYLIGKFYYLLITSSQTELMKLARCKKPCGRSEKIVKNGIDKQIPL